MYTVFLVDDEPFILEGLTMILCRFSTEISILGQAENGEQALNYLRHNPVDLLITDIRMPAMDGIELIRQIKKLSTSTRFIILSGYDDFAYVKEGIHLGIENYLLKPVNIEELEATLENTLEKIREDRKNQYQKTYMKRNFEILRENILYRWMKNTISEDELMERASLIDVNLQCESYQVILLRMWYDNSLKKEADEEVYLICQNYFSEFSNLIWFQDIQGHIVIVFVTRNQSDFLEMNRLEKVLFQIQQKAYELLRVYPLITLGKRVFNYTSVWESYEEAKELQKYRWVFEETWIINKDKVREAERSKGYKQSQVIETNLEQLSNLLIAGDQKGVTNFVEEVFGKITSNSCMSVINIQGVITELILTMEQIACQLQLQNNNIQPSYDIILSCLQEARNLEELKETIKEIAIEMAKQVSAPPSIQSPIVRQVIQYTLDNYTKDLSLKILGDIFNTNSVYLGQLFKKETGQSYVQYFHSLRMQKAKSLLLNSHLKIHEIALQVGYSDVNYFYRVFKKYVGISPSEVRGSCYTTIE